MINKEEANKLINQVIDAGVKWLAETFCEWGNLSIILCAIVNAFCFFLTKSKISKAEEMFNPKNDKVNGVSASMQWNNEQISQLKGIRKKLIKRYTWYANITAILPLLGILGTVAALVTNYSEIMTENFMIALGTTFLGVLFAIIFKAADAKISGPMDVIVEDADYVIQEYESEKRRGNEA